MATHKIIDINDVKTTADINLLFSQQCIAQGLEVSLCTYLIGIFGIPLAFRKSHRIIPIGIEYKLAIGAVSMMTVSYFAGVYAKNRCERNLKKKLQEINLIH